MQLHAYLCYNGRCDEAIAFYTEVLCAEVVMKSYFKDMPDSEGCPSGAEDNVMHATLKIGESMLMVSDGCGQDGPNFDGFSMSLSLTDETEARRLFDALSKGGEVQMPLAKTFWSPCFGMVKDQFGLPWMLNVLE
ncbi:MAG: VOC family protein [Planctomycetes bacterium]|nr:VOC family protein [Planctomycetota bacterium]